MKKTSTKHNVIWNEIVIPETPVKKCEHYFEFSSGECKCRGCGLGLMGVIDIKDGKPI